MKNKQQKPKLNRQILEDASTWFVAFRVGDVDSRERTHFEQWLRQSPEHIRAYLEIARTYVELPALKSQGKIDVKGLIAYARSEANVVSLGRPTHTIGSPFLGSESNDASVAQRREAPNSRASSALPRRRAAWFVKTSLAASIAIVCMASLLGFFALNHRSTYTTQIAERRSITLKDGSTIDLNARSEVRIKFSKAERNVELIDGQALFEVAKDKTRPFIVRSGETLVRAVGTQFDVYRTRNRTTVIVIEGRVAVLTPLNQDANSGGGNVSQNIFDASAVHRQESVSREDAGRTLYLSAGERVTVTNRAVSAPERVDVAAATAWVQRRFVFDASRLSDVVDNFNRYNARQLVIEDPRLDDLHVSGVYSSTDPASLVRFLRSQPGIDVVETDEEVRVTRK